MSWALSYEPTAVQAVADTHDTASSALLGPDAFGLGTTDQAVPFHDSTRVLAEPPDEPTAVQSVTDTHDTPNRLLSPEPFGLGTADQAVPFHDSTRVFDVRPPPTTFWIETPTAVQSVADRHDTPYRMLSPGPGFGLGTTDQAVPFHDSTKVSGALRTEPTAVQSVADTHDTPFRMLRVWFVVGTSDQVEESWCTMPGGNAGPLEASAGAADDTASARATNESSNGRRQEGMRYSFLSCAAPITGDQRRVPTGSTPETDKWCTWGACSSC
jgi:hypothetical protein